MTEETTLVQLTADIVTAHVSNNAVAVSDLPDVIQQVHKALKSAAEPNDRRVVKRPAISVRKSVSPDYITCMVCGQKQKLLRRHLVTAHEMAPEEYRKAYGLADNYPMVAPNYSKYRRELANAFGLGRQRGSGPRSESVKKS